LFTELLVREMCEGQLATAPLEGKRPKESKKVSSVFACNRGVPDGDSVKLVM